MGHENRLKLKKLMLFFWAELSIRSGWDLKSCRASIGPDAGAKSRFFMNDRASAIAGIKQRECFVQILLFVTGVIVGW